MLAAVMGVPKAWLGPAWYFLPESENSSCLESALDSQGVLLAMT
jgi:hypothetical protein